MKYSLFLLLLILFGFKQNVLAQTLKPISTDSVLNIISELPDSGMVVVNFWATWCGPCVREIPHFYKADSILKAENITFIFISFDMLSKAKSVQKFILNAKMPGTHYQINSNDLNLFIGKVQKNWEGSIPYTIVLTNDERRNHEGTFETFNDLWNFIRE